MWFISGRRYDENVTPVKILLCVDVTSPPDTKEGNLDPSENIDGTE